MSARIAACVVVMLIVSATAWAQTDGRIVGTVTDPSGAVVPNATLAANNEATGLSYTSHTDSKGQYIFALLPTGPYTVRAEAKGFKTAVYSNAIVTVAGATDVNFTMHVGSATETVQVSAESPVVETTVSGQNTLITKQQIDSLPLNGRLVSLLTQLLPGATPGGSGGNDPENQSTQGAVGSVSASMNGVSACGNAFTLDGVANVEPMNCYITIEPPLEAIQEFNVQRANADAEYGNFASAKVNLELRSGTNAIHGSVFEFNRNSDMMAKPDFTTTIAPFTSNQYGGTIGGPIIKNKAFFFADFQGFPLGTGTTTLTGAPDCYMLGTCTDAAGDAYLIVGVRRDHIRQVFI